MIADTIKMTARQFLQLGEDPAGVRLELIDGEIAVAPSPTPEHSRGDTKLRRLLDAYVEDNDLGQVFGDVDTVFGEHDVRRPDILWFSKARLHLVHRKAINGPPDLCVEIVSPGSTATDRKKKFKLYERGGVAYYWIMDPPKRCMEAFQLIDGRYVPAGRGEGNQVVKFPPFDALEIPLQKLWWPA